MIKEIISHMLEIDCTDKVHKYSIIAAIIIVLVTRVVTSNGNLIKAVASANKSITLCKN